MNDPDRDSDEFVRRRRRLDIGSDPSLASFRGREVGRHHNMQPGPRTTFFFLPPTFGGQRSIITMRSFETLSSELVLMILQHLSTPKDLHSTIRASPVYLAVFRNNKPRILAIIIRRSFSPILRDAVLALCASPASTTTIRPSLAHLKYHKQEEMNAILLDPAVSIPLCRLWRIVSCFVDSYCQGPLARLQNCTQRWNQKSEDRPLRTLSDDERHRLQRAFVRFETYRRRFGGPDRSVWRDTRPSQTTEQNAITEQHRTFVGRFSAWELEELHSVYDYLVSMVEDTVDGLESRLFADLQTASKEDDENLGAYTEQYDLDLIGLSMFQQDAKQSNQIAYMVELGLPFLQRMREMNMNDRMATVASFAGKNRNPSLGHVLQDVPGLTMHSNKEAAAASEDPINRANVGWLWRQPAWQDSGVSQSYGLRSLGYAFWDEERLVEAGLLGLGSLPKRTARDANPSVERRLQGVRIREGALCKLQPSRQRRVEMEDWLEEIDY